MALTQPQKNKAAWLTICVACVSSAEGLRQVAYRDPVGIPTICFGETAGVKLGDRATLAQCEGMLIDSLLKADKAVQTCTKVPLPDERRAALVSFTYNVGGNAYCGSTLVKLLNDGNAFAACNQLPRWNRAHGIPLPGLTTRREKERQMCLKGLA